MDSETTRVEAFSDGVFAIAITLLILEITVPPPDTRDLTRALAHEWPSFLAFAASFANIGVMWMNHHRLFSLIHHCDDTLLALNLALLLGVTWIPFPTAVLAEHLTGENGRVAALLYAGSFFVIAIIYNWFWHHASYEFRLLHKHADEGRVRSITRQYRFGPVFYLVIAAIGLFSPAACLTASLLLALYFALPPHLFARRV